MKDTVSALMFLDPLGLYRLGRLQDRQRLSPFGPMAAHNSEQERNAKAEGSTESDKSPQCRKADDKDQGASDRE